MRLQGSKVNSVFEYLVLNHTEQQGANHIDYTIQHNKGLFATRVEVFGIPASLYNPPNNFRGWKEVDLYYGIISGSWYYYGQEMLQDEASQTVNKTKIRVYNTNIAGGGVTIVLKFKVIFE